MGLCPHESPNRHCVSLFLLAATFPTSVCLFLAVRLHQWEEGSQGRVGGEAGWRSSHFNILAPVPNDPQSSGVPRGHHLWPLWSLIELNQEPPSSHSCPTYPQEVPRMGHPHPQGNRALLYWPLASGEGGDTRGLLRVGEGGRNSHGMLGMLML